MSAYVVGPNATAAALRAGYSKRTARQIGAELLSRPVVAREVQRRQEVLSRKFAVSAESVIAEYAKIVSARITDYLSFGPSGVEVFESSDVDDARLDAIAEVNCRTDKDGRCVVSIKLYNKLDALGALSKHLGLFAEQHQHDVSARLHAALTEITAHLSSPAQSELLRAVGHVLKMDDSPLTQGLSASGDDDEQRNRIDLPTHST